MINSIINRITDFQHYSEILSGTSRSLFTKIAGLFTAYLFAFAVARFFGAEAWGIFSLALSIIMLASILGSAGIDIAMLKITASLDDHGARISGYKMAFNIIALSSLTTSLITFFVSGWIANTFFANPVLAPVFKIASFAVFPFCILNLNARVLQGLKKINQYVFIRFVSHHLAALLLLLILYLFWPHHQIILFAYVGGLYLILFLSFWWLFRENLHPFKSSQNQKPAYRYTELVKLAMPLLFANALIFVKGWMDTIMVGFFMTEHDVGIYNIALKISGLLLFVLTSVNAVVAPNFSNLFSQKKFDELNKTVRFSTSLISYATLPLFLILILFPEQILSIFGKEFIPAKNALWILCIGSFLNAMAGSVGYFMQMTDSQTAFQNITLISFLLGFTLNLILIPNHGIEGAAIATCTVMIFWNFSGILYVRKKYNITAYFNPFRKWKKN